MKKLILDVDTGIDDALAIAYALGLEEAELIGVTCCFGNVRTNEAADNTLKILHLLRADQIPVFQGENRTFAGKDYVPHEVCKRVHGADGIGEVTIDRAERKPEEENPVSFMAESAKKYGSDLVIVATAAMTNLAHFIKEHRKAAEMTGKIAVMGGALIVPGNVTRFAEANILADPEAADYVCRSGIPFLMTGLDVTLKTSMSPEQMEEKVRPWRASGTVSGEVFAQMVHYYCSHEAVGEGEAGEGAIHDPLAVAAVFYPELVNTLDVNLLVETDGESRGRTIADLQKLRQENKTASVCVDVDAEGFLDNFVKTALKSMK